MKRRCNIGRHLINDLRFADDITTLRTTSMVKMNGLPNRVEKKTAFVLVK